MTKARENHYLQVADSSAIQVLRRKDRAIDIDNQLQRLLDKYASIASMPSGHQFVHIAATLAHCCAAVLAGLNMAPILFSLETGLDNSASWSDYGQTILPISIVFFLSLAIGLLISKIQFKRDDIAPRAYVYQHVYVWASLIVIVIYFALLYHIVRLGVDQASPQHTTRVHLVLTLSLAEIVIATFAHLGWTILSFHYRRWYYRRMAVSNKKHLLLAQQKCDRYYQYYLQTAPSKDFYLTLNIEQVLVKSLLPIKQNE